MLVQSRSRAKSTDEEETLPIQKAQNLIFSFSRHWLKLIMNLTIYYYLCNRENKKRPQHAVVAEPEEYVNICLENYIKIT